MEIPVVHKEHGQYTSYVDGVCRVHNPDGNTVAQTDMTPDEYYSFRKETETETTEAK